ncbi:MAG: phenylpyruvate tautomerase MIF-related protein [Mariprofundaceae bacterium]|nr:phenylpyruvate tautomerase MIF-related protein [Mariprofundaceae bacterium]
MPYLSIQTNVLMDDVGQETLLRKASQTVASVLGKPESYVMINLDSGNTMLFAGSDAPLAYLQLKSLGLPEVQTSIFSQALCELMQTELGIDSGRVYIEFSGPERHMWGWNGGTF